MAKVINDPIPSIEVNWENYSGQSVETFIKDQLKSKAGYFYRTPQKIGDYYYMYGFYNQESWEKWMETADNDLILCRVQFPNLENDTFSATLATTSNTDKLVNLGEGVVITLQYKSYSTNPTTHEVTDTYNDGTLIIMRSANGAPWSTVGRVTMSPVPYASSQFVNFDLTPYIVDGDNKIRLRVEDNVNGSISNNVQFASVIDTTLAIRNATDASQPLSSLMLKYYIEGQVAKTLNVKITDSQGHQETFSQSIGSNTYIETPYQYLISDGGSIANGIIQVEAWLTVDDTVLQSDHVINQFYYYQGSGDTAIVLLNNVNRNPANYTTTKLFDFVVYNKTTNVVIRVTDGNTTFLQYTYYNCVPGTIYNFVNTLEVESDATTVQLMYTATTSDMTATEHFTLDNSENFNPTAGADFILNPKLHNNSEAHPNTIINEVTGKAVTSTWQNFSFGTGDGWVQNDLGYPVLRVPAGRKLTINYDSLDNTTEGTTIELDYMVYGVFDDNEEVLRIGNVLENGNVLGLTMRALDGNFMTQDNQSKRDQDFHFGENRRMHLAVNILPNVSGSGLNYVRLFINGIINREFQYTTNDVFHTDVIPIIIGAENNDVDIFSIRVYKKGLSASDVRQDYMSSIPTTAEKIAYKTANDILSANGTISYDKARVKYNTLVWTGKHPEYWTGNVKYRGDLKIEIVGDPAHSGTLKNVEIKGQGSSSRGYWKWNHTHKIKNDSVILDNDGNVLDQSGWQVVAGTPYAKLLVSKRNWASSAQSHKIGATKLYNDLWKAIVGGNGITRTQGYEDVRNAVIEVPFLMFFRDNENATPVFDGFSTWGSAKHDEPTFWGSTEVFPDYMMMEGSDNGIPLTLFQVPWFEDEVHYSADDDAFVYANMVSWDWEDGNDKHEYWVPMHNFIYEHSTRLRGFTGDATTLDNLGDSADKSYQYYNTTNGKVYRYDYIGQRWVNGGTTKTEGQYDELNIFTQTGLTSSATVDELKAARVAQFKAGIGNYINVNDHLYSMQFIKMIAASDNWCKNTFFYLDPVTHKWCLMQDDLDTIFATDNVGRNTKPYWVEEHDTFDNGTKYYFNGEDNVFFNLMQEAFETELRAMMKTILDTMASSEFGNGSVTKCMDDYFFSVQKYFPAVAYNETARLLYEEAAQAQAAGQYTNGTPPLSQSMGDMLSCEEAFWERRGIYLASYASSSPFYVRSTGSLGYRSVRRTDATNPTYRFQLKPWIYLYPKTGIGQSMAADNTRVHAGTVYQSLPLSTDGNTDCFIYGADYYTDFGEFGGHAIGEAFNLSGQHLRRFSADSRVASDYQFRPLSMTVLCPNLQYLCLYGCSTLSGSLDLRDCKKIITLDLRGTGLTGVMFPESDTLTTANVPGLTSVTIKNCPALSTFYSTNISALQSLTTDNQAVLDFCLDNATNLTTVVLDNVDYTTEDTNKSNRMYDLLVNANTQATGHIKINKDLNRAQWQALVTKYGNIDDPSNQLYVEYNVTSSDAVTLTGVDSIGGASTQVFQANYVGSDFNRFEWTISGAESYTVSQDGSSVSVTVPDITGLLTVSVVCKRDFGHSDLTATKNVTIVPRVYPTALASDMGAHADNNTSADIDIHVRFISHNIAITDLQCTSDNSNKLAVTGVTGNDTNGWHVTVNAYGKNPTSSLETCNINCAWTDAEGNNYTGSFSVGISNDIWEFKTTDTININNQGRQTYTVSNNAKESTINNVTVTGVSVSSQYITYSISNNTVTFNSSKQTGEETVPNVVVSYRYELGDGKLVTNTVTLTVELTEYAMTISFGIPKNTNIGLFCKKSLVTGYSSSHIINDVTKYLSGINKIYGATGEVIWDRSVNSVSNLTDVYDCYTLSSNEDNSKISEYFVVRLDKDCSETTPFFVTTLYNDSDNIYVNSISENDITLPNIGQTNYDEGVVKCVEWPSTIKNCTHAIISADSRYNYISPMMVNIFNMLRHVNRGWSIGSLTKTDISTRIPKNLKTISFGTNSLSFISEFIQDITSFTALENVIGENNAMFSTFNNGYALEKLNTISGEITHPFTATKSITVDTLTCPSFSSAYAVNVLNKIEASDSISCTNDITARDLTGQNITVKGSVNITGTITPSNSLDYEPTEISDTTKTISGALTSLIFKPYNGGTSALTSLTISDPSKLTTLDVAGNTSLRSVSDGTNSLITASRAWTTLNIADTDISETPGFTSCTSFTPNLWSATTDALIGKATTTYLSNALNKAIAEATGGVLTISGRFNKEMSGCTIDMSDVDLSKILFQNTNFQDFKGGVVWKSGTKYGARPLGEKFMCAMTIGKWYKGKANTKDYPSIDIAPFDGALVQSAFAFKHLTCSNSQRYITLKRYSSNQMWSFFNCCTIDTTKLIQIIIDANNRAPGNETWFCGIQPETAGGDFNIVLKNFVTTGNYSANIEKQPWALVGGGSDLNKFGQLWVTGSGLNIGYKESDSDVTLTADKIVLQNNDMNGHNNPFKISNCKFSEVQLYKYVSLYKLTAADTSTAIVLSSGDNQGWNANSSYVVHPFILKGKFDSSSINGSHLYLSSKKIACTSFDIDAEFTSTSTSDIRIEIDGNEFTGNIRVKGNALDLHCWFEQATDISGLDCKFNVGIAWLRMPKVLHFPDNFCKGCTNLSYLWGDSMPIGAMGTYDGQDSGSNFYRNVTYSEQRPKGFCSGCTNLVQVGSATGPFAAIWGKGATKGGTSAGETYPTGEDLWFYGCTGLQTLYWCGGGDTSKLVIDRNSLPTGTLSTPGGEGHDTAAAAGSQSGFASGSVLYDLYVNKYWTCTRDVDYKVPGSPS